MTHKELLKYCFLKKGSYIDHPFGYASDIIKVKRDFCSIILFEGDTDV